MMCGLLLNGWMGFRSCCVCLCDHIRIQLQERPTEPHHGLISTDIGPAFGFAIKTQKEETSSMNHWGGEAGGLIMREKGIC